MAHRAGPPPVPGDPRAVPPQRWTLRRLAGWLAVGAFLVACWQVAQIDPARLWHGLPRLAGWMARGWPPDLTDWPLLLQRAAETVAMATLGTVLGALIAAPVCLLAARNLTPEGWAYGPARVVLNLLRGIDSFIFALIFVAAVGLGPFAGILGIGLHSAGSLAKLWSETMESTDPGPLEAAGMTAAGRLRLLSMAVLPDVMPALASTTLYVWEFNVRSSTVLGLVGAGGLGQELRNAVDLLQFDRVLTILVLILAMVTIIDRISAVLRRRLM